MIWIEFEYSLSGETFTITVRFYMSETAPTAFLTDVWIYNLTQEVVSVDVLKSRLYDRVREIEQGIESWNNINTALNALQNTRLNAEDVID